MSTKSNTAGAEKPRTTAAPRGVVVHRPCSALPLKEAVEAGMEAHRKIHIEHPCWRRLIRMEHEAIVCAAVAVVLDVPESFVSALLDVQMGRLEDMPNVKNQAREPSVPNPTQTP